MSLFLVVCEVMDSKVNLKCTTFFYPGKTLIQSCLTYIKLMKGSVNF